MGLVACGVAAVLGFVALYLAAVYDSDWWLFVGVALVVGAVVCAIGPAT